MNMRWKKIWMNEGHTKYCIVKLYKTQKLMQEAYQNFKPQDKNQDKVSGVHCGYEKFTISKNGKENLSKETGTVFLNIKCCGAGVVSHEFAHAVLWAHKHKKNKNQYPIVIKNMDDEEEILYHLTHAVQQFYNWFWTIKKKFK
jgi:hypothetical protein